MWVPKVVCWKLWLERNSRIFRDIAGTPIQTSLKVKAMLGDLVASKTNVTNEVIFWVLKGLKPLLLRQVRFLDLFNTYESVVHPELGLVKASISRALLPFHVF
jgi:hypothetical protein